MALIIPKTNRRGEQLLPVVSWRPCELSDAMWVCCDCAKDNLEAPVDGEPFKNHIYPCGKCFRMTSGQGLHAIPKS